MPLASDGAVYDDRYGNNDYRYGRSKSGYGEDEGIAGNFSLTGKFSKCNCRDA